MTVSLVSLSLSTRALTLSLTHSYSLLHTNPQTCQTKNKTVEHAEKKIMQYGEHLVRTM